MSLAMIYVMSWLTANLSGGKPDTPTPEAKPRRKLRGNARNRHLRGTVRIDAGQPLLPQLASLR